MKKIIILLTGLVLLVWTIAIASQKELEIQRRRLVSQKPPFTLGLPSEFELIHSTNFENPKENSVTRVYFFIKEKNKQVEEMFIVQIADKTNPQAGPMSAPPLKPYTERRMYQKDKITKGELTADYLIQLMAWNPDAPSLQPILKKGISIPSHWALQGQFLFIYLGEHVVLIRYSKDANLFGFKVSEEGDKWNRDSISGNEKRAYEAFKKIFVGMIDTIQIKSP
jgi:hypothetical protein